MDWFVQTMMFLQEWWPVTALLLFVVAGMAADLSYKFRGFVVEFHRIYPNAFQYVEKKREYVIKCYDRLPTRIRAGFAMIGGKKAWAHLVNACYAFIRKKQHRK